MRCDWSNDTLINFPLCELSNREALKCSSVYCRALDRPVFKPRWALLCSLRGLFPALRRAGSRSYILPRCYLFIMFLMRKLSSESLWHGSDPGSAHADPWLHLLHHLFEHTLHASRIHALFFTPFCKQTASKTSNYSCRCVLNRAPRATQTNTTQARQEKTVEGSDEVMPRCLHHPDDTFIH